MARPWLNPSDRAASSCPRGTAWMPARIVSAMYAAATSPRASATLPVVPPGTWKPGNASGTATPMRMKTIRAGNPRNSSMYSVAAHR